MAMYPEQMQAALEHLSHVTVDKNAERWATRELRLTIRQGCLGHAKLSSIVDACRKQVTSATLLEDLEGDIIDTVECDADKDEFPTMILDACRYWAGPSVLARALTKRSAYVVEKSTKS